MDCNNFFLFHRAAGGELQAILDEDGLLSEDKTRICIREVLKALEYLHRRHVAHLDIKPQNILLNTENVEGNEIPFFNIKSFCNPFPLSPSQMV